MNWKYLLFFACLMLGFGLFSLLMGVLIPKGSPFSPHESMPYIFIGVLSSWTASALWKMDRRISLLEPQRAQPQPICSMTNQQSLDDIRTLLLTYSGVTSATVFSVSDRNEVVIRFRCTDINSLKSMAASSVWSNVLITVANPQTHICGEPEGVFDLPLEIVIPDIESDVPTHPERFGVYISANLADQGLITEEKLAELHIRWNTRLANRKPRPPAA